jgi:hypothetical protein
MFDNDRYVSKGIQQTIPLELQSFMWNSIDKLKAQKYDLDYLQIFQLTKQRVEDIFLQQIIHSQELPKFVKTYILLSNEAIDTKVFVIDNGKYSTMLLYEEY